MERERESGTERGRDRQTDRSGPKFVPMSDVFYDPEASGVPFRDVLVYRFKEEKIPFHEKLSRCETCPVNRHVPLETLHCI